MKGLTKAIAISLMRWPPGRAPAPSRSSSPRAGTARPSIAVVPFGGPPLRDRPGPVAPIDLAGIVSFDLVRSGQFDALSSDNMLSLPDRCRGGVLPGLAHPRHGLRGHRPRRECSPTPGSPSPTASLRSPRSGRSSPRPGRRRGNNCGTSPTGSPTKSTRRSPGYAVLSPPRSPMSWFGTRAPPDVPSTS